MYRGCAPEARRLAGPGRSPSGARLAGALVSLAVIAAAAQQQHASLLARAEDIRTNPTFPAAGVITYYQGLRELLAPLGLRHPRMGVPDVGGSSLAMREAQIVDTAGLADWVIARNLRWNEAAVADYLEHEIPPTLLDIHGPGGAIGGRAFARLRARYVPLSSVFPGARDIGAWWIVRGVAEGEDPRCPGGQARVLALSPDALAAEIDAAIAEGEPLVALALHRCALEHRGHEALPNRERTAAAIERALAARERALQADALELAVRFSSLATVLAGDAPHLRRETEALRARLLPPREVDWLDYDSR